MESRVTWGVTKGLPSRSPPIHESEAQHLRQRVRLDFEAVDRAQSFGDFLVERGQRGEDGDVVVVEAHLDLVVDGGPVRADFIGLPEAGNLGADRIFEARQLLRRHGGYGRARQETLRCAGA